MEHKKIFQDYLKKLKIENPKTLSELEEIFFIARKEFYDYKISVDQFSSVCEDIWIIMQKSRDLMTSHLETAVSSGAELSWYIRQRPEEDARQLNYFLQYINDYKKEK